MLITATDKPLRVDYKINGKFYNNGGNPEGGVPQNTDTHSDYPFDDATLQPGESFNKANVEVVRVVELGIGGDAAPQTGAQD